MVTSTTDQAQIGKSKTDVLTIERRRQQRRLRRKLLVTTTVQTLWNSPTIPWHGRHPAPVKCLMPQYYEC